MSHLERNKFVHRDLAARNVFLTSDDIVKIGDFGLTKDIQYMDYYKMTTGGLMPYKWMAPECILERKFSSKGKMFSYFLVIFHMRTSGKLTYRSLFHKICHSIIFKLKMHYDAKQGTLCFSRIQENWLLRLPKWCSSFQRQ